MYFPWMYRRLSFTNFSSFVAKSALCLSLSALILPFRLLSQLLPNEQQSLANIHLAAVDKAFLQEHAGNYFKIFVEGK